MSTIEKAIEIAARAHAGQIDKAGAPYIFHPLRVMMSVTTPYEQMTAVLHDVVEDTAVTLDDLRAEGFPDEVLAAIGALTKTKGEKRIDAAKRAVANPIARIVKLADVRDNMDLGRIPNPSGEDFARLNEYAEVKRLLENPPHSYTVEVFEGNGPVGRRTFDTFDAARGYADDAASASGVESVRVLDLAGQIVYDHTSQRSG